MAVFAALRAEGDPRRGLLVAVNHSGDSDSTGALAGQLLGALHGEASLPTSWATTVEARETILTIAQDLARGTAHFDEYADVDPDEFATHGARYPYC